MTYHNGRWKISPRSKPIDKIMNTIQEKKIQETVRVAEQYASSLSVPYFVFAIWMVPSIPSDIMTVRIATKAVYTLTIPYSSVDRSLTKINAAMALIPRESVWEITYRIVLFDNEFTLLIFFCRIMFCFRGILGKYALLCWYFKKLCFFKLFVLS